MDIEQSVIFFTININTYVIFCNMLFILFSLRSSQTFFLSVRRSVGGRVWESLIQMTHQTTLPSIHPKRTVSVSQSVIKLFTLNETQLHQYSDWKFLNAGNEIHFLRISPFQCTIHQHTECKYKWSVWNSLKITQLRVIRHGRLPCRLLCSFLCTRRVVSG